ncbi:MAG: hypothetical protein H0X39_18270 [Actinobacteria bacterium]|nr:hypothetical protein [Actinomycetota bacterium]
MALPTFKTKDEIPKGFEEMYEERDGTFQPKALDDGGKSALQEERRARQAAEKLATKAADERAELERKLAAATAGDDLKEKEKVARALAKFDTDLATEKAKFQKELDAARGELRTLKLDDKVKAAFLAAGGRPERAEKALRDTKDRFDLADDGRIVVKDAKGEVTSKTVEDFFGKDYRGEMAEFYAGTKAAGGGGTGGSGAMPAKGSTNGKWDGDAVLKDPLGALNAANADGEQ